jgi:glycosyltransferase involved in cell wall biosynthesis
VPVHALRPAGKGAGRTRLAREVAALARETGTQVLHAVGTAAQLVAARAAKDTGLPELWSQPGVTQWGRLTDLRAGLSPARAVLLYSREGEAAQRKLFYRRSRCRRLTAGVGLPERLPEHRHADARAALGIAPEAVVAASLGPLGDAAAHETFLRAAASLCHARPHARLIIAGTRGDDGGPQSVMARAAALKLEGRVVIVPPANFTRALDAADIAVYDAAASEPLVPVPLLQALAAGLAVVVHDGPLVGEIVTHADNALLSPRGDHEALAVALLALADDPHRRAALGSAAARLARERHDAARMAAEVLALYRDLLAA